MFKITVDTSGARTALQRLARDVAVVADRTLFESIESARRRAFDSNAFEDRTGELRSTIQSRVDSNPKAFDATLFSLSKHAIFVEEGTRPHVIAAKNVKFLRFEKNGETFFRKSVHHPGTKATHFMLHAIEDEAPHARDRLERYFDTLTARFR